jgi:cytoskeletal protein RodZ
MVEDPLKTLVDTFKKARLQAGLSVEELAEKCRIAVHHIENIENANREAVPEEAYLMGFLNKISKALNLKNYQTIIEDYKKGESQYIVQNILNENHIAEESNEFNISFLKIYHLYIFIGVLILLGLFYLLNPNKKFVKIEKQENIITLSTLKKKGSSTSESSTEEPIRPIEEKMIGIDLELPLDDSDAEAKENPDDNDLSTKENSAEIKLPKVSDLYTKESESQEKKQIFYVFGDGQKSLKLKVREVAWFQVYGIAAGKTLFEGEAYPDVEPSKFEFKDDIGFALASGNAGAFKVYADGKTYILGQTGQLIKWYYPEGAKYEYKLRRKS